MNKNKNKGKYFENKIQKILQKYFDTDDRYIYRQKTSGISNNEYGDIFISPTLFKKFPFIIECKFGYNFSLDKLFSPKTKLPVINKFLYQLDKEIKDYQMQSYKNKIKLYPILIISNNYKPIYVFIQNQSIKDLKLDIYKFNYISMILNDKQYIILLFDDFLKLF